MIEMIKRNTIQRALVLEAVNKLKCHATADEIYNLVVSEYPNISKVTVYRNLNQLADSGEIRKLEVPGGADRFDHRPHNHYHARCLECGDVFDVDMDYISDLEKKSGIHMVLFFRDMTLCLKGFVLNVEKRLYLNTLIQLSSISHKYTVHMRVHNPVNINFRRISI